MTYRSMFLVHCECPCPYIIYKRVTYVRASGTLTIQSRDIFVYRMFFVLLHFIFFFAVAIKETQIDDGRKLNKFIFKFISR